MFQMVIPSGSGEASPRLLYKIYNLHAEAQLAPESKGPFPPWHAP